MVSRKNIRRTKELLKRRLIRLFALNLFFLKFFKKNKFLSCQTVVFCFFFFSSKYYTLLSCLSNLCFFSATTRSVHNKFNLNRLSIEKHLSLRQLPHIYLANW